MHQNQYLASWMTTRVSFAERDVTPSKFGFISLYSYRFLALSKGFRLMHNLMGIDEFEFD